MSPASLHLLEQLQAVAASLENGDFDALGRQLTELEHAVRQPGRVEPEVLALFETCRARAREVLTGLAEELDSQAKTRRAAAAYGGER